MNEDKPRGLLLNRSELAHALAVAKTTIDTWKHDGMPVYRPSAKRGIPGQYDLAACVDWLRMNRCYCTAAD